MITHEILTEAMYGAMREAATRLPPDVTVALERALAEEQDALARRHLEAALENAQLAAAGEGLVCADTGFPLFFVRAGRHTTLEGGFETLWRAATQAVRRATAENVLRPTMVDPLSRDNPGDNIGPGMPKLELVFRGEDDGLEIVAAPKGGGSEIFGTFYRMLFPSDGVTGIKKFVIECIREACYAGKICPPAILGVGLGGTADLCMKRAKEAALLRSVGSRHPDPLRAELEAELLQAARALGIGPMGAHGINAVMAVHVATAVTHTAALPVAVNAQCLIGRRWSVRIAADNTVAYSGTLNDALWNGGEEEPHA